ncbi:NAD(P)-dependent alcohol dehydrogenase [Streptomyces sp. GbtcB7]|uniref:NAD(P)-dependent alcohol dehydrogenase n=1 Tax=Streptomyces sp. GbtcB7 TaxID=2824752 RepID=UPI0027E457C3|nr:NAD(P)-dependent alcohol dehydrogenase [Streptomyces sp. GbtcB7]
MRAAVMQGPGLLALEERNRPEPGPHEVLVRVTSLGICGSDVSFFRHGKLGHSMFRAPVVLGHEPAGEVVACGRAVTRHRPGQRVSVEPGVPCGTCGQCRTGHYNRCADIRFLSDPPYDGAMQEYVVIHEAFAHPVPDSLSDDAAALIEPLSVAVWAGRHGRVGAGDRVLITGAGPIGLLSAQVARALGATEIAVSDVNPARLDTAKRFGATTTFLAADALRASADVAPTVLIECSGSPRALAGALPGTAAGGRVVLVGMGPEEVSLPLGLVQQRELTISGVFRYANTWETGIALASSGRVDLDGLVTDRFSLADAGTALNPDTAVTTSIKTVIDLRD